MKKLAIAVVLSLVLITVGSGVALAKAENVQLAPDTINYHGLTGGGFVIFNNSSGVNNLEVTVSLKKADTSVTGTNLDVYLYVDYPSGGKVGTMTVNKVGNGNFHINTSVAPGTHKLFIILTKAGYGANMYRAPGARGTFIEMTFK